MVLVGTLLSRREADRDTNPDNVSVPQIFWDFHQSLPVKTESQAQGIPLAAFLPPVPHAKTQEKRWSRCWASARKKARSGEKRED